MYTNISHEYLLQLSSSISTSWRRVAGVIEQSYLQTRQTTARDHLRLDHPFSRRFKSIKSIALTYFPELDYDLHLLLKCITSNSSPTAQPPTPLPGGPTSPIAASTQPKPPSRPPSAANAESAIQAERTSPRDRTMPSSDISRSWIARITGTCRSQFQ